ncbi:YacL family protein [Veronia pacifica]|uniref:Uncharacterized protein n=1 Tax=Veronia pacifica TaxID=1080227 RepID=A0A1C3EIU5_9GAMM|nr:YacL family protein [Veronia pacifica]ODA33155.1 hypothetical protein A8L45_11020 [Veronia pacifica]
MDYEFRRNTLDDSFHAELSMGHEALGRWLVDELGTDSAAISKLLSAVEDVSQSEQDWNMPGKEFHLTVNREEALIQANSVLNSVDSEPENDSGEDLREYDDESISLCGLEDFVKLVTAWQDFIKRYGR